MKEIKSVFFRIIFNLPLGFVFLKVLEFIDPRLCLNMINVESFVHVSVVERIPAWFWVIIYLSLLLIVGEIVSLLGEWLINWLFKFPAFWSNKIWRKDHRLETIAPCSPVPMTIGMLVATMRNSDGVGAHSEMHFSLSRLLAGLAWLCFLVFAINGRVECIILFVMLILIFICPIIICQKQKYSKKYYISYALYLLSGLFILLLASLKHFAAIFGYLYPILTVLLAFILLAAACIYRAMANLLTVSK